MIEPVGVKEKRGKGIEVRGERGTSPEKGPYILTFWDRSQPLHLAFHRGIGWTALLPAFNLSESELSDLKQADQPPGIASHATLHN
jgi:hypothetical protein